MKSINSWIKRNPLITAIVCVLAVVLLTGFVSLQTNNFNNPEDLFTRDLNEDNLLKPGEDGNYKLVETKNSGSGVIITPKKNGAIVISGNNSAYAGSDETVTIAELKLPAGTYTVTSSDKTTLSTVYVSADFNGQSVTGDFGANKGTFTLAAETTVTITLHVIPGSHDITLYPVLVSGSEAGNFYA